MPYAAAANTNKTKTEMRLVPNLFREAICIAVDVAEACGLELPETDETEADGYAAVCDDGDPEANAD